MIDGHHFRLAGTDGGLYLRMKRFIAMHSHLAVADDVHPGVRAFVVRDPRIAVPAQIVFAAIVLQMRIRARFGRGQRNRARRAADSRGRASRDAAR